MGGMKLLKPPTAFHIEILNPKKSVRAYIFPMDAPMALN